MEEEISIEGTAEMAVGRELLINRRGAIRNAKEEQEQGWGIGFSSQLLDEK